jgi:hypothetical protein
MTLKKGTNCCILEFLGKDYIALKDGVPRYSQNGKTISPDPVVILCKADDATVVPIDTSDTIEDGAGTVFNSIVGARPSNIVKR